MSSYSLLVHQYTDSGGVYGGAIVSPSVASHVSQRPGVIFHFFLGSSKKCALGNNCFVNCGGTDSLCYFKT
jgi:hypothetical protein